MANKTMTRIDALTIALSTCENTEAREVLSHMIDQLSKPRKSTAGTKTPARVQNEQYAHTLADMVETDQSIPGSRVMELLGVQTPQKVVGVMKVAEELGLFARVKVGKQVMYTRL